jgi:pimeloyl-ACP methyl ester carboxylesterase
MPRGTPVLFVAGERDREAPPADVRRLAERCAGDARLCVLAGLDHEGLFTERERHRALSTGLLERALDPQRAPSSTAR